MKLYRYAATKFGCLINLQASGLQHFLNRDRLSGEVEVKYAIIVPALVFGLLGIANAAGNDQADSDAEIRASCVEAAIAGEVEKGDQFDKSVESCVQEAIAQREKEAQKKG